MLTNNICLTAVVCKDIPTSNVCIDTYGHPRVPENDTGHIQQQ